MATKRNRIDGVDTLYRLFNTLIGRVGELEFDLPAQKKFQGIVISDFIKDVEQSFTNWLNRVQCHGERQGTSWQSRFGSKICGSAPGLFAAAPILRSDGGHEMSRMHAGAPGQVPSVLRRLPELGPALAVAAEFAGRIGIALCFSMASRTLLPLRDALREC